MAYYSDPQHQLLAKIADGIETLNKTLADAPVKDAKLLADALAENIRLKEVVRKLGEDAVLHLRRK